MNTLVPNDYAKALHESDGPTRGFGFAAGCAAVAPPRRQRTDFSGLCPRSGLSLFGLNGPGRGIAPKFKSHVYGGA